MDTYLSDKTPDRSKNPPNVNVYADIIHCRSPAPTSNSLWIAGSEIFAPVMNTLSSICALAVITRIRPPRQDLSVPTSG